MEENKDAGIPAEQSVEGEKPAPDIKNVQAEFYRKTDKLMQENQRLSEQLAQITTMIQQGNSKSTVIEEDLEDLAFKDPKAYAKKVSEKAEQKANEIFDRRMQQYQQSNTTISQLANDYPELSKADHDLTKRAIDIYKSLSPQEQGSPLAYKSSVREAAAELGILPKSKRSSSNSDDFSLNGGKTSDRRPSQSTDQMDDRTIAFAEAVGLNIKDKKVLERIKQRSQRKAWGKYE